MSLYRVIEFTCVDCGAHVTAAIADATDPSHRCAVCSALPGWWDNPRLRELFTRGDPERRAAIEARYGVSHAAA